MIDRRWKCINFVKYKLGKIWEKYAGVLSVVFALMCVLIGVYVITLVASPMGEAPPMNQTEISNTFSITGVLPIIIVIGLISGVLLIFYMPCRWSV